MTKELWDDLNTGDVVLNAKTNEAYTVADSNVVEEQRIVVLARSRICVNPDEWILVRRTADYVEA